jgi:hypothetical protein
MTCSARTLPITAERMLALRQPVALLMVSISHTTCAYKLYMQTLHCACRDVHSLYSMRNYACETVLCMQTLYYACRHCTILYLLVVLTCHTPLLLTRRVTSLISTGANRLLRSFLCTHRKFISTVFTVLSSTRILWYTSHHTVMHVHTHRHHRKHHTCLSLVMISSHTHTLYTLYYAEHCAATHSNTSSDTSLSQSYCTQARRHYIRYKSQAY